MSAWPESVWRAAALRGLDARARAEIAAAGSLTRLEPGQLLFQQGEPADAFYVVAEGAIDLRVVKRGESEASVIRRATEGEALGEEATLRIGVSRAMDAVCVERARVASVSMAVFRRATGRVGGGTSGEIMARVERTLRRATTLDMLRTASFMRDLPARDADVVLDAVEHVFVARGDVVFRQGDAATHVYVVAEGMLKLESEDSGRLRVHAYVARGDVVGEPSDSNADGPSAPTCSAVAAGPSWLLAVPRDVFRDVVWRHRAALDRTRRIATDTPARLHAAASAAPHVLVDAYRLSIARSLLVIDQDACVRPLRPLRAVMRRRA